MLQAIWVCLVHCVLRRIHADLVCHIGVPVQVRGAASVTAEREARALAALEKSSAERAAALAAREKLLQEREEKVSNDTTACKVEQYTFVTAALQNPLKCCQHRAPCYPSMPCSAMCKELAAALSVVATGCNCIVACCCRCQPVRLSWRGSSHTSLAC